MNNRIQELVKKAQNITAENHAPGGRDYEREIYVKFAELLIKKCGEIAVFGDPCYSAQHNIHAYFGVE